MESRSSPDRLLSPATLFLLLLTGLSIEAAAAAAADIPLGSILYASNPNSTRSSPDSTFSLGFIPSTDASFFIAGVNFNCVSVWQAGGTGVVVDSAGSLQLTQSGDLQLLDGSKVVIWSSNTSVRGATSASLEDSDKVLRSGRYSLNLTKFGNLTLKWDDRIEYWTLGLNSTVAANLSFPTLSILAIEGNSVFRFLRLDSDGNLRIYSATGSSAAVNQRWAAVPDQCQVFGYCRNFGICSYNDSNPVCGCPSLNFDLIDARDRTKGCKRKLEISNCTQSIGTVDLEHTKFLTYPPESSSQIISSAISACRLNCLTSIPCVASTALSDGSGLCYSKTIDFISGYQSPSLPGTSYLKVCGQPLLNPTTPLGNDSMSNRWRLPVWVVIVAVLGTLCEVLTKGFKEKLGEGGFGAVYRGVLANKTVAAVKQLEGVEQGEKQFRMEVATISSTHHLNLVRLIGFCSEGRHRLLVYEFMKNGSLDNFLFTLEERSGKLLNWEVRFGVALGTAGGIMLNFRFGGLGLDIQTPSGLRWVKSMTLPNILGCLQAYAPQP
ncbi:hypothetical protein QQ045_002441 [Rhodiola kirilowii]